jgi:hypothetical protein
LVARLLTLDEAGAIVQSSHARQISGRLLETAWREDNRRMPNGSLHSAMTAAALAHPVSRQWNGYWQR